MIKNIAFTGLAITLGLLATGSRAEAASYQHLDSLALQVQGNAARLYKEFQLHYRHTAEYGHLIADARDMYNRARHIHTIVHIHGDLHHVSQDVQQLDQAYHHLERLLKHIEVGAHHGVGGHVHGETSHVYRLMKSIECDIHHMRQDLAALTQPNIGHGPILYYGQGPVIQFGHGHGQQRSRQRRNYGEIRSGWRLGLKDF